MGNAAGDLLIGSDPGNRDRGCDLVFPSGE